MTCNLVPLAYLAAQTYGLADEAAQIAAAAGLTSMPPVLPNASLLVPPCPIYSDFESNWPQDHTAKASVRAAIANGAAHAASTAEPTATKAAPQTQQAEVAPVADWGADDIDFTKDPEVELDEGEGWDIDAELDIEIPSEESSPVHAGFAPPSRGPAPESIWVRNSTLAADHAAAGSFESAMQVH
jgi:coatomer subunit alpha